MLKDLTPNQLLLIAIATVLLLLAAVSFYLLQDPSAPLPFVPPPGTSSATPLPPALTIIIAPTVLTPTRQTSYTPLAAFITPNNRTPQGVPTLSETPVGATTSPRAPIPTASVLPINTPVSTRIPPTASSTTSPTATGTLSPGESGVTGRIVQNGTPVANVVIEFADDVAPRNASTNSGGHYWFITLAPGTDFTLTFNQSDNFRLTPTSEIASVARIEGFLPTGANIINLPDFEVSINLNSMFFELQTPTDGTSYSASAISPSYPFQFDWSQYNQGESYFVEIGPNGSDDPIWSSDEVTTTNFMWNGTLDDGTHITQGSYWWWVAVTKSLGNYNLVVFTRQFDIQFTP